MNRYLVLTILFLTIFSCYYDNELELYGENNCSDLPVAYSGAVTEIIQRACYQCHSDDSQLGGINLEGYDNIAPFALNGSLLGSMKHESGFSPMPQDRAILPSCEIDIIEQWVDQGAPNN